MTDAPLVQSAVPRLRAAPWRARRVELAGAPALPTREREEVVVTDPHYNTLVSHEIVGHPVELDRALKMETAYAGRSWLLTAARRQHGGPAHRLAAGERVLRPGPARLRPLRLRPRGHAGPPRRPASTAGVFTGFMNSRQTAAIFGGAPNGHFKATDAALVPLDPHVEHRVRGGRSRPARHHRARSTTAGTSVGHRIPSIAESRENFRISRPQGLRDRARASSGGSIATAGSWRTPATT